MYWILSTHGNAHKQQWFSKLWDVLPHVIIQLCTYAYENCNYRITNNPDWITARVAAEFWLIYIVWMFVLESKGLDISANCRSLAQVVYLKGCWLKTVPQCRLRIAVIEPFPGTLLSLFPSSTLSWGCSPPTYHFLSARGTSLLSILPFSFSVLSPHTPLLWFPNLRKPCICDPKQ